MLSVLLVLYGIAGESPEAHDKTDDDDDDDDDVGGDDDYDGESCCHVMLCWPRSIRNDNKCFIDVNVATRSTSENSRQKRSSNAQTST